MLRDGQPWKSQEIQHLLKEEFDVEYHPDYLWKVLRELGLSYTKPRPKRPYRPENPEEILDEDDTPHNREEGDDEEGWTVDDDVCTDGGTVLGFFDASQPQPYDNSRRVWYVDDPHVERPLVKTKESVVGFYALNGENMVRWKETEEKERICEVLEAVREQNPLAGILLVLDKHGSHVCEYTRKRAHQFGINLIFLPSGSPHLNPIEQVWKYLKWTVAPIIVKDVFDQVTQRISFAKDWSQEFLDLQKFP